MLETYTNDQKATNLILAYLFLSRKKTALDLDNLGIYSSDYELFALLGKSFFDKFNDVKDELENLCVNLISEQEQDKNYYEIICDFFTETANNMDSLLDKRIVLYTLVYLLNNSEQKNMREHRLKLINIWINESGIDSSILSELMDIHTTSQTIESYQNMLGNVKNMSYKEINEIMQELEKNKESLLKSQNALIAFG
jgi:hypothetical protein